MKATTPTGRTAPPAGSDRLGLAIGAVLVVGLAAFGAFLFTLQPAAIPDVGEGAKVMPEPRPLPEFSLVDHDGAPFGRARLEGQWSLLFFGYTHCPDVCPFVLQQLAHVAELARQQSRELPQIVFVSVDRDRDSSERLQEYVHFFDPSFVGASGEEAELSRLARGVGAYYQARDTGDAAGLVDHSSTLFLVDPQARFFAVLDDPHDPAEFTALLERVRALGDS